MLEIRETKKMGRGVFATETICRGAVLFRDKIIHFSDREYSLLCHTKLCLYVYECPNGGVMLPLGMGSLLNHKKDSNVRQHFEDDEMVFVAKRRIQKGCQLFYNYQYNPVKTMKFYLEHGYVRES